MYSFTKIVCFFFLLTTLLSSLPIHARDSQFFSKVSRTRDEIVNPNNNNNVHENEVTPVVVKEQKQPEEEQPTFLPQTTHTGYGLYGHDTGLNTPSTTATTTATVENSPLYNMDVNKYDNQINKELFTSYNLDKKNYMPGLSETSYTNNVGRPTKYVPQNNYNNHNNNHNYDNKFETNQNDKNYVPELTGLSETSYTNNVIPTKYVAKHNYDNYFNNHNNNNYENNYEKLENDKNYVPELTGLDETSYTNDVVPSKFVAQNNYNNNNEYVPQNSYNYNNMNYNNNGDVEKQGMSDTRYMENGKYYYDINSEKEFYPSNINNDMSYSNNYNNKKNSHEKYFNNNKYYNGNGMQEEGNKNQFSKEDEFDFDDQP